MTLVFTLQELDLYVAPFESIIGRYLFSLQDQFVLYFTMKAMTFVSFPVLMIIIFSPSDRGKKHQTYLVLSAVKEDINKACDIIEGVTAQKDYC